VLIHYSFITCECGTGWALIINGGVIVIVHFGLIPGKLRAGPGGTAAAADVFKGQDLPCD
ncbi:hypothetical protein, partial [Escherichia coli]|uniref:hypothetical protein n=1 Tax=Escherichia coli TaxID=562 RepID=UPI001BC85C92